MSIRLIVDSASDLNKVEAEALGALFVPLTVELGDEIYHDGVDMTKDDFYKMLEDSDLYPATGAPAPQMFRDQFEKVIADGDKGICITLSHNVSGSYNSAKVAQEGLDDHIYVLDSYSAALGERVVVEYARELIEQGLSYEEIIDKLEANKKRARIFAYLDTLDYVQKGGRLSKFASVLGGVLKIKPILSIDNDGSIFVPEKVRGMKKGLLKLNELVEKHNGFNSKELFISYSGRSKEVLEKYLEMNKEIFDKIKINISQLGATIGSHAGPGTLVVAFMED